MVPEDLLLDILEKVPCFRDLANFDAACRIFHTLRWPVMELNDCTKDPSAMVEAALLSRHIDSLRRLVIQFKGSVNIEAKLWNRLERCRSTLEELTLHFKGDVGDIWSIMHGFPRLSVIQFSKISFDISISPRSFFPCLKSATLWWTENFSASDLDNLVRVAPLLEYLSVMPVYRGEVVIHSGNLKRLKLVCREGVELSLGSCEKIEEIKIYSVRCFQLTGSSYPALHTVWLSDIHMLNISRLLADSPCLQDLRVKNCKTLDLPIRSSSLRRLRVHVPSVLRLECLNLEKLWIDGGCILDMDTNSSLNIVELSVESEWNDGEVEKLVRMPFITRSLRQLNVCFPMKEKHIREILSKPSSLVRVDLTIDLADEAPVKDLVKEAYMLSPQLELITIRYAGSNIPFYRP